MIVAVDGPDEWDDLTTEPAIVGYAVTAGAQVLELCCLPEFARAAPRLLVRACQDAIERDHHTLTLHTAASDPLHELIVTAGGTWCTDDRHTGRHAAREAARPAALDRSHLSDPAAAGERRRACRGRSRCASIPATNTIDSCSRGAAAGWCADEATAADVRCDPATFSALLVGNLNVARARDECRLEVADDDVLHKLAVLFPPSLFWQSQFDTLRF